MHLVDIIMFCSATGFWEAALLFFSMSSLIPLLPEFINESWSSIVRILYWNLFVFISFYLHYLLLLWIMDSSYQMLRSILYVKIVNERKKNYKKPMFVPNFWNKRIQPYISCSYISLSSWDDVFLETFLPPTFCLLLYLLCCHCPESPEKGDPSTRELLRRADSTGPVSPTCKCFIRPKAGNAP